MALTTHDTSYAISEVTDRTGISADTLRYYERVGLLRVDRNAAGQRRYSERDLGRVVFISKLRAAGLPIARLQRYFALVAEGTHTEPERLSIMEEHREELRGRIAELEAALAMIEHKIDRYGGTLTHCQPAMTPKERP